MAKTRRTYSGNATPATIPAGLAAGATSCTLSAATGWPGTAPFYVVVSPGTASEEKILVGAISGTTISSFTRGVDGTSDQTHATGAAIYPVFTAVDADEANELTSKWTAKGDLVSHGASTFATVSVGTNSHVLQADSAQAAGIKWGQVATAGIADDAVTAAKIAAGAVAASELASNAVETAKILDANVTTAKLADGAVTEAKLADNAVTNAKIGDAAVDTAELADGAVETAKIADANVTEAKIADGAVAATKVKSETWTSYTPTVSQPNAIANITVNYAKYIQLGKTVVCNGFFTVGASSGTANNDVTVSLPVTAEYPGNICIGSVWITDNSTATSYAGAAVIISGTTMSFTGDWAGAFGWGKNPNVALASNDTVRFSISYEAD